MENSESTYQCYKDRSATSFRPHPSSSSWWLFCLSLVFLIQVLGCSHSRDAELREGGVVGTYAAEPPTFLTGAMGVLLTNGNGYSAHATIQNESLGGAQGVASGQLFCRGSKLLFAPASTESKKKKARSGGFAFIWDVATGSGYVLSGALQAYAPVSLSVHATNVVRQSQGSTMGTATVQMNDGTTANFQVSPSEVPGVIGQINAMGARMPLVVSLSGIRLEVPPEEVFTPADDFNKYANPEAMADEVAARQRNLRRKAPSEFEPMTEPMRGMRQ